MKALVGTFNQEKALVGAVSVIVQLHRLIVYTALQMIVSGVVAAVKSAAEIMRISIQAAPQTGDWLQFPRTVYPQTQTIGIDWTRMV